jgi:hypothetical protein
MACTPLAITAGFFINASSTAWSTAPSTTMGGKTVTRTAAGISVTAPSGSLFLPNAGSNVSSYMFFGSNNYLLILQSEPGPGPVTRYVTLINFTTPSLSYVSLFSVLSDSTFAQPNVQYSQGSGSAFLIFAPTPFGDADTAIYRSDTGALLCSGPPPFNATGQTLGEATATDVKIHYSSGGVSNVISCPLPLGNLTVQPASQIFPQAVVGGPPALASTTRQFTLHNTGTDCLTINAIGNVAPFSVTSTSTPLPATLGPGATMTVTVTFAPTTIGSFGPTNLPVTRTPAKGDDKLTCQGTSRAPITRIGFNATSHNFGQVPVGGPASTWTLTVGNVGEVPLNVSVGASPAGSPFQWGAFNGTIPVMGSQPIPITFAPPAEASYTATLSVVSNDPASPASIALSGVGCLPNAAIVVPPVAPISLGQVQRGFRTVRFITIKNTGDGPLTFRASISGPDASLYGLQQPSGSVTDVLATRDYTVDPTNPCGPLTSGSGETDVAVAFFANAAPRMTSAQLVIDNHNATNTTITSWTFPLSAEIISLVSVDAALVFDRSGSMSELVGARTKSEAAIAGGQLFAELTRPDVGDRLTLVKFDDVPEVMQPITEITSANQPTVVGEINSTQLAPRGSTSIVAGVAFALNQLATPRATPPPALTKAMVVLTDGMDNTAYQNPSDGRWYSILGGMAWKPAAQGGGQVVTDPFPLPSSTSGLKIYGIGLGKDGDIDKNALNRISTGTGGYYGVVGDLVGTTYFDLEKYFTQIYMDVVTTPVVTDPVYTISPGQVQRIEFDVLRGDVNALVVIYDQRGMRLPFHIVSPRGETIEPSIIPPGFQLRSGSTNTARFVEFRMPLGDPDRYAGRWAVVVEHHGEVCFGKPPQGKDARLGFLPSECRKWQSPVDYGIAIGVGSNFRMQPYVTPGVVHIGEPILLTAVLTEADLPVTGGSVTVKVVSPSGSSWSLSLLDDGAHDDGDANNGEYARQFTQTAEEGSYEFHFRAVGTSRDGEPVIREAVRAKYVQGRITPEPGPGQSGGFDSDCCKALIELLERQTEILLKIFEWLGTNRQLEQPPATGVK